MKTGKRLKQYDARESTQTFNTITDNEFHNKFHCEKLTKANNQMDKDGAETGGLYNCINRKTPRAHALGQTILIRIGEEMGC